VTRVKRSVNAKKKRQLGKPLILSDHDAPRAKKLLRTGSK
jgi:hypothetical protein